MSCFWWLPMTSRTSTIRVAYGKRQLQPVSPCFPEQRCRNHRVMRASMGPTRASHVCRRWSRTTSFGQIVHFECCECELEKNKTKNVGPDIQEKKTNKQTWQSKPMTSESELFSLWVLLWCQLHCQAHRGLAAKPWMAYSDSWHDGIWCLGSHPLSPSMCSRLLSYM